MGYNGYISNVLHSFCLVNKLVCKDSIFLLKKMLSLQIKFRDMSEKPIVAGITQGDVNGIGYEVIIKALSDARMMEVCTPIVYGSSKTATFHRKLIKNSGDFSFRIIQQPEQRTSKTPNMINVTEDEVKTEIGKLTSVAGEQALAALKMATNHILEGKIDVLLTAPINKHNIHSQEFPFEGHTEYLAQRCKTNDYLMLMIADGIRIGTVTTHCALSELPQLIKSELIVKKIKILNTSLQQDFLCTKPKIAVLSLNPHASENGMFGKEEKNAIVPAIKEAFDAGIYVFGPYPADGFFGTGQHTKFDGILAMYHDQAMIPFKLLSYGEGVNYTAGLPFVRTSPAHGTAYEIAGKDMASADSFRKAIYYACDIYNNRKQMSL
jgi:4-hydroxythreonine-4-phosphate dehydrogenase